MSIRRKSPDISIVINTLNRGPSLDATINSFKWLRYDGDFEVIVVNGPSTDNSEEVIAKWGSRIRVGRCPVANLSVSRNIGICMARGEIVAFIDDDAIPEPEWLRDLAAAYSDPQVGAAGGFVFDHTGYDYQATYCVADRFAGATPFAATAMPYLSYPKSLRFPHLLGANSSFRTSALLEIGGFDEEFEYYLDETDVCVRIIDAGYLIAQLPRAYVHHKYAPSNLRGSNRVPRFRYPIIKNKIYFMLKHAREFYPMDQILREQGTFVSDHRRDMTNALAAGLVSADDFEVFNKDVERAVEDGFRRGLEGPRPGAMIDDAKRSQWLGQFAEFIPLEDVDQCTLVLVTRSFPPEQSGGVATFMRDLAEAYAERGNIVHVVTQSNDINRVDLEHGAWIHRIVVKHFERPPEIERAGLPQDIWNWSASAHAETQRIATHREIGAVEAPIWDCEGIAFLTYARWPLVTSLQTTMHFWLDTHPEQRADAQWMSTFGNPLLFMEKRLMKQSDGIRSISHAIRREIEEAYGFRFEEHRTQVRPLGMRTVTDAAAGSANEMPVVLFVGRLEARKGIDVLLESIPMVLAQEPSVEFRVIGNKTLPSQNGKPYADVFLASEAGRAWHKHIRFEGHVDEEELRAAYASCDIFVAPSRFESFGLVFLEAMRAGKPVIGCYAGGMSEVVAADECGLLVAPGDASALAEAILQLLRSPSLRQRFGERGRARFVEHFSAESMAQDSVGLYRMAQRNHAARRERE